MDLPGAVSATGGGSMASFIGNRRSTLHSSCARAPQVSFRQAKLIQRRNEPVTFDDVCLHTLFERQAASSPNRVAAVSEGCHITYGELDARANQLAHLLRTQGVGPDIP